MVSSTQMFLEFLFGNGLWKYLNGHLEAKYKKSVLLSYSFIFENKNKNKNLMLAS